jgi:hypothetical protein
MLDEILKAYGIDSSQCTVTKFGSGLINSTWKISNGQAFILQRVNDAVFKNPPAIAQNIRLLGTYFKQHYPEYYYTNTLQTTDGSDLVFLPQHGYFRMFSFVPESHSVDVVITTKQAFEAARQFGLFTQRLAAFDTAQLQHSIPDFHNLSLRYRQFLEALEQGNAQRKHEAAASITYLLQQQALVSRYEDLKKLPDFKLRVTHHDTKISNVLFDTADNGLCVIDLDTVMPGYFISDVGDMMRTYLSPVSEEEKDFSKITVRAPYFNAIVRGYLSAMQTELSATEKTCFVYAGKFMVYMQALRFVTDYLNNDRYYGSNYEGHNLVRTNNQVALLQQLIENEPQLQQLVQQALVDLEKQ